MTSVTPPPPTTFSGLASGIDTTSIINKLQKVAQQPIQNLVNQDNTYNNLLKEWQNVGAQIASLQAALITLTIPTTFNAATGTSSNTAVASLTASPGATIGSHSLTVTALAQSQELTSADFTSATAALNQSGTFDINGKTISLVGTDALSDVATKINNAKAGVTASVITVGPNDVRLIVSSSTSGTVGAISAVDSSGTSLNFLGLVTSGSATAARQAVSYVRGTTTYTGAASIGLSSAETAVATASGYTGTAPSGTVQINGTSVAINLGQDSLNTIAAKINGAGIAGVSAQVVAVTDSYGNVAKQQLQIVNATTSPATGAAPTFVDSNGVLATLGVVQGTYTTAPVAAAQDAKFNLDGINFTRSTNTIGDILSGANFQLLTAGGTTPATTTLSITQNTASTVTAVQAFATAYNAFQDYVTAQNTFTPPVGGGTGTATPTPPLFGDSTLTNIQNELSNALGSGTGSFSLGSAGLTIDQNGHLNVDQGALTTALQTNSQQVAGLFGTSGTTDASGIAYSTATDKTVSSNGAGYAVNISQAATQSSVLGTTVQTGASTTAENLIFSGSGFVNPIHIALNAGNTVQATVNQINGDSDLSPLVTASIDPATGKLLLAAHAFGSGHSFQITSDQAASSTNSGLGTSSTSTNGVDVIGSINGEAAGGVGQMLTGNSGNKNTDGLVVKVTGTTLGVVGHVTVTHGLADALNAAATTILDPTNGDIAGATNSLNSQITDTEQQITDANNTVAQYTDYLTTLFNGMESRISQIQSQGAAFAAQLK